MTELKNNFILLQQGVFYVPFCVMEIPKQVSELANSSGYNSVVLSAVPLKEASIPWAVLTGMVLSCLSVFPPLFCSTASPAVWWTVRRGWHFLPVYLVMNSPMILGFTGLLSILITPTRPAFMLCM